MGGIKISGKKKATAKLLSELSSYIFEQQFGEMSTFTKSEKETLEAAKNMLAKHIN